MHDLYAGWQGYFLGVGERNSLLFESIFLDAHPSTAAVLLLSTNVPHSSASYGRISCEKSENKADRHKSRAPRNQRRTDRQTNGRTDEPTKRLLESHARD